jgi:inward rectifier potassium channel
VPRGDGFEIVRIGNAKHVISDLYALLLDAAWWQLASSIILLYALSNIIFAFTYLILGDAIDKARPDSFQDAFFFSVQTMATIGYGKMTPNGLGGNILVSIEALFGLSFFAMMTGMVFAKLSRPTARVLFSDVAVIGPYDETPHFMLRLANQRGNRIVDAKIQLVILVDAVSKEGIRMRRFYDLPVARSHVPLMQYTWTIMHAIDKDSPLYKMDKKALEAVRAEIIVSLTGLDETYAQTIHARRSYIADEILCDAVFEDIMKRDQDRLEINYTRFHDTRPIRQNE